MPQPANICYSKYYIRCSPYYLSCARLEQQKKKKTVHKNKVTSLDKSRSRLSIPPAPVSFEVINSKCIRSPRNPSKELVSHAVSVVIPRMLYSPQALPSSVLIPRGLKARMAEDKFVWCLFKLSRHAALALSHSHTARH